MNEASKATAGPDVIAHRGGNGQWPGETMAAYKGATALSVDVLEMDVYLTADRELILMHDERVDVTTEGDGNRQFVSEFELDEIQALNAAYHWSAKYHKPLNELKELSESEQKDLRVPSLREIFETFPEMRMVIEMKHAQVSPAKALCDLIRKCGMTDKVLVASFSPHLMKEFRGWCPEVKTSLSPSPAELAELLLDIGWPDDDPAKPSVLEAQYLLITEGLIKLTRKRGMKLHAWTVNDLDHMIRMRDLGVDGIITDFPGPLMALLGRVGTIS
jgi:glycerophosphoryl diester phosphodiesterase